MAAIGHGYGSEWHFQRWLGYHRKRLNALIEEQTGLVVVDWMDFEFQARPTDPSKFPTLDAEIQHLDFLPDGHAAKLEWQQRWPFSRGRRGKGPCWDAIAKLEDESWLLVEAKAHLGELKSPKSGATPDSLKKIRSLMDEAKEAFEVKPEVSWVEKYYQQANRMAVLWFLTEKHQEKARLLNICFTGDQFPKIATKCPKDKAGWDDGILTMKDALGLSGKTSLEEQVHYLFLPVTER